LALVYGLSMHKAGCGWVKLRAAFQSEVRLKRDGLANVTIFIEREEVEVV